MSRLTIALAAVLASQSAVAQTDWSAGAADLASGQLRTAILNANIGIQSRRAQGLGDGGCWKERWCVPGAASRSAGAPAGAGVAPGGAAPAMGIALTYQPTAALARGEQQAMIGRLRRNNPEAAQALAEQFGRHDFQQVYLGLTAPFGLKDNDTADILTAYTALGYLIATGSPDPSPQAVRSLRAQIAPKLAANPQLAAPETRAKLGEELKILFVTLHAGWQSARREGPGALDRYSDGVAQLFRAQGGEDLRRVRLTSAGFVAR